MKLFFKISLLLSISSAFANPYETTESAMSGKKIVITTSKSSVAMTFSKLIPYDCKQKFLDPKSGNFHDGSYAVKLDVDVREYDRQDCDESKIGESEVITQAVVYEIPAQYDKKTHQKLEQRVLTFYIID